MTPDRMRRRAAIIVARGERYRAVAHSTTCEISQWCTCLLGPHWHQIDAPRLRSITQAEQWLRGDR
jgi:hypothetical protein